MKGLIAVVVTQAVGMLYTVSNPLQPLLGNERCASCRYFDEFGEILLPKIWSKSGPEHAASLPPF